MVARGASPTVGRVAAYVASAASDRDRSTRTTTDLETGVLDSSATESSGTSTLASGKYVAAQPGVVG
jgi:hypothetical protein